MPTYVQSSIGLRWGSRVGSGSEWLTAKVAGGELLWRGKEWSDAKSVEAKRKDLRRQFPSRNHQRPTDGCLSMTVMLF